jgi:hypothetical protein
VLAARAAGADGVVDKTEPAQHLLAAIRRAVVGEDAMPAVPIDAYEDAVATLGCAARVNSNERRYCQCTI